MDIQELKKILATISIAGLLTSAIPLTAGCSSKTDEDKKGAQTEETAVEAPAEETPAPGSLSGDESGSGSAEPDEVPAPSS